MLRANAATLSIIVRRYAPGHVQDGAAGTEAALTPSARITVTAAAVA